MDKTDGGFDAATFAQQFNQFSPEYGPHFKDIYGHMPAHCPVAHTDEVGGFWVVTRYADIMRVARDYEAFSSRYGVFTSSVNPDTPRAGFGLHGEERTGPLAAYPPGPNGEAPRLSFLPLELDPPLHGPYRKAIDPLFSPHPVTDLAPWLDETEFENPEEVDFDRANKRHMAFGLGPHRCIAADVVRLEFRSMFEQILSRMPDFRVDEAGLRPSPGPAVVDGYEHVPFVFMLGKKVGGPRVAY